jgi:hypothetical protein
MPIFCLIVVMCPAKASKKKSVRKDVADTFGVRGAGATSAMADFGQQIDLRDLLFAIKREPVANRLVFQVAHDVFDKWFKVEEVSEKPDPSFDREVQRVLAQLDAKSIFSQMAAFERGFGWAIIAMTFVDYGEDLSKPVKNPKEIRELFAYAGDLHFTVQNSDEDKDKKSGRYGLPVFYTLNEKGSRRKLHFSRAIHFATRLLDHNYKGLSILECIYDDLTVGRNVRWGLGQTIFRYGSGFPDVKVEGASGKDLDKLEASQQFKSLQARIYFLHNDKTTLEFKGVAGKALNPEPYNNIIVESISTGSGVPATTLRGTQAGAVTGSEVNQLDYSKIVSDAQGRYEPGVRQLIDLLIECGQIQTKVKDYRIVWNSALELTETQKANVELGLAQARDLKTSWMTVDEIRAEQGLKPLPDGAGKVVLGLKKAEQQPFEQLSKQISMDQLIDKNFELIEKCKSSHDSISYLRKIFAIYRLYRYCNLSVAELASRSKIDSPRLKNYIGEAFILQCSADDFSWLMEEKR